MIDFNEAFARVAANARPVGTEPCVIGEAAGRVLAEPVVARIDSPRCDVSAMDGYAVREAELACLPARLEVAGESFAGAGWKRSLAPGQCARVFTGAPVPDNADRVVMQELVEREGGRALFASALPQARHIRRRGSDFEAGSELLSAGRLIDKRAIVAAAGADRDSLTVHARPRVVILSTGDELTEPGKAQGAPDSIPDSVSLGIAALVTEWGGAVESRERCGDALEELRDAAGRAAAYADLVVVTGGASVGERDFAKAMFDRLGLELIFEKVSIKPGKPVWFGRSRECLVMGLPGNPTSAMVTARLFLAPLVAGMSGREAASALHWKTAALAGPLPSCGPRETFHRARWAEDKVALVGFQDSSAQAALADADVLIRQPADSPASGPGDSVQILDF